MATGGPTQNFSENYRCVEHRIRSFKDWPLKETHKPERLASVGFVYTGVETLVRCFCCGTECRYWCQGDNPLSVHQKCNPNCSFLKTLTCKKKPLKHTQSLLESQHPNNHSTSTILFAGRVFEDNQTHINIPVEAESSHFASLRQPHHRPFAHMHLQQSPMTPRPLPGHCDLMTFSDNDLPRQHHEQSESEGRGSIDPFRLDADSSRFDDDSEFVDQPSVEHVAASSHTNDSESELLSTYRVKSDGSPIDDFKCGICHEGEKSYILVPCGHTTCEQCAARLCPHCGSSSTVYKVYNIKDRDCKICREKGKNFVVLLHCGHITCGQCSITAPCVDVPYQVPTKYISK